MPTPSLNSQMPCPTVPSSQHPGGGHPLPVRAPNSPDGQTAYVRCMAQGGKVWLLFDVRDISRFWAADKYTWFWWPWQPHSGMQLCETALSCLEEQLAPMGFLRVHRRELVNLRFVRRVSFSGCGAQLALWDGQVLKVSRRASARLKARLKALERLRPLPHTPMVSGAMARRQAPESTSPLGHEVAS